MLYQFSFEQTYINLADFSKHFNFDRNNAALRKRICEKDTLNIPSAVLIIHLFISFPKFTVPRQTHEHSEQRNENDSSHSGKLQFKIFFYGFISYFFKDILGNIALVAIYI